LRNCREKLTLDPLVADYIDKQECTANRHARVIAAARMRPAELAGRSTRSCAIQRISTQTRGSKAVRDAQFVDPRRDDSRRGQK
jgi:hypothetical protein